MSFIDAQTQPPIMCWVLLQVGGGDGGRSEEMKQARASFEASTF